MTVTFDALDGTASGTDDYTATDPGGNALTTPATITIMAGQTEATTTVRIDPTQDTLDESDGTTSRPHETIVFSGTASGGLTTTETATLTIVDDDTASTNIQLSVDTSSDTGVQTNIGEGDSETTVTVTATLGGSATYLTDQTVAVQVANAPSSNRATPSADATSGDYRLKNFADTAVSNVTLPIALGNITIAKGTSSASKTFKVTPNDDHDLGAHRDHPRRRHPDGLQRGPHRHQPHRQRPAAAHAELCHHVHRRGRRQRDPGDRDGHGGPERLGHRQPSR